MNTSLVEGKRTMLGELKEFIRNERNFAEEFLRNLNSTDIIVLCGGGGALCWYCRFLDSNSVRPNYIIDKGCSHGEKFGIPIVTYEFIMNEIMLQDCKFVITAPKYREEIIENIKGFYGDVKVYSFEAEIYYMFLRDINGYRNYLLSNYSELVWLYEVLEDEKSRETFISIIKGRISGEQKYFADCMTPDQYFPEDIISLTSNEIIVEAGSNDGKTLLDIINKSAGLYDRIYCFEPDKECINRLEKIVSDNRSIYLIRKGVGEKNCKVFFKTDSEYGASHIVENQDYDYSIDITSMDEELGELDVTYIKMDIEGMELECLKGAINIITRCKPKLAICVYHKKEDIIEIPRLIMSLNSEYKLYLRHHNWGATETVLYAV